MWLYSTVILIALELVCQHKLVDARACNGRSTVIQVRVPPKTNVTVKYPSQISPVRFVPSVTESDPQCFQCKNSKCQKCNNFNPTTRTIPSQRPKSRTNIIIDLKGNHPKKANASKNLYDTLVYIGDKNTASSVSNSTAKSTGGAAATTSAAASTSNTALIAAFNENENNGSSLSSTENVYLEDTSESSAISSASALADNLEAEKEPPSESRVPDQDQPSKQQPQAEQAPTQEGQLPATGQQLTPEKQPVSEQQPTPDQPPVSEQQQIPEKQKDPQVKGEETKLDNEKEPESLNPTPAAENAKESEKSLDTDKSEDVKADAAPPSPKETGEVTESNPDDKKVEENEPAVETAKP